MAFRQETFSQNGYGVILCSGLLSRFGFRILACPRSPMLWVSIVPLEQHQLGRSFLGSHFRIFFGRNCYQRIVGRPSRRKGQLRLLKPCEAQASFVKTEQCSRAAVGPDRGLSNRNLCGSVCDLKPLLNPVAPHNMAFKLMMPRVRRGGQNPTQPCELKILKGGFRVPDSRLFKVGCGRTDPA